MVLFKWRKDGGPESHVEGFFLIEWKAAFTIVLLRFSKGSREAYHSHAFGAISWVLKGLLLEYVLGGPEGPAAVYRPSLWPVWTPRERFHKVYSYRTTWVISFRGPWAKSWREFIPKTGQEVKLEGGRKVVEPE